MKKSFYNQCCSYVHSFRERYLIQFIERKTLTLKMEAESPKKVVAEASYGVESLKRALPSNSEDGPAAKVPKLGMRNRETRMFNETILFLNKSTTKFLIIGINPVEFTPNLRICDRSSGDHISMNRRDFEAIFCNTLISTGTKSGFEALSGPVTQKFSLISHSFSNTWRFVQKKTGE